MGSSSSLLQGCLEGLPSGLRRMEVPLGLSVIEEMIGNLGGLKGIAEMLGIQSNKV